LTVGAKSLTARGRRQRRSAARPALVALVCVVGLLGAGWAVVSEIRRSPGPSVKAAQPTLRQSTPRFQPTGAVSPAVQVCVQAVERGEAAISRAEGTVKDWTAHVQAMADQLAGRITEAETKRIWASTRDRGAAAVAGFQAARVGYRQARDRCLRTPVEEVVPEVAAAVATCRDVSRQTDEVLGVGGAAVADWAAHLRAMQDREAGRLDPHHAWQTWLRAYRAARVNIDKFAAANRVYQDHARCGPPAPE
jgi:hypothetical protein